MIKSGDTVVNVIKERKAIGRLLQMHSNKREELKEVYAGNIAAAVGPDLYHNLFSLCPDDPIVLERMGYEPVIGAIEPKTKSDSEKMGVALQKLAQEDPSFRVQTDEESGQTIISGMGSFTSKLSLTVLSENSS